MKYCPEISLFTSFFCHHLLSPYSEVCKVRFFLCLTKHYDMKAFLTSALVGGYWPAPRSCRFTTGERAPSTHWIGSWVGPRAGLDEVEKQEFMTLPGLELEPLARPARSQPLYQLCFHCQNVAKHTEIYLGWLRFNVTFTDYVGCFRKCYTIVFQMLLCGKSYETIHRSTS
jgi:hypothetical protein